MLMVVAKRQPVAVLPAEVVVAATEKSNDEAHPSLKPSLTALTLAALALPGIAIPPLAQADDNLASLQYGYYQEGERNTFDLSNRAKPIRVDTLSSHGETQLSDRLKLGVNYSQDTWSGATPIATAPRGMMIDDFSGASSHVNTSKGALVDKQFNPLEENYLPDGTLAYQTSAKKKQLVHMLTSASPETRKQGDIQLGYEWDEAALSINGGVSSERDYESHFIGSNGRVDFNQKLTSLTAGMSYTDSDINALKMESAQGYIDYSAHPEQKGYSIRDNRQDWSGNLGITQIINKNALISSGIGYTRSTGYLSNPYKTSTFVFKDPNQLHTIYPSDVFQAEIINALENRPGTRNQFTWDMHYIQYLKPLDAALRLNYRFFQDDWNITAHTINAAWDQPLTNGWIITPNVRYYTQNAADFYEPVIYLNQARPQAFSQLPINHFSSDHRLSGYGALSGGISLSKRFAKGINFSAGFEYYKHAGSLKLGNGGEDAYADFDYYLVNAGLDINLSALSLSGHSQHAHHSHDMHHNTAPAGVMFEHMMPNSGSVMVGYRYMYGSQSGNMLQGTDAVSASLIGGQACGGQPCEQMPKYMHMHMHMLDLMYAPTDWLNLMLMPQFVDMNMAMEALADGDTSKHPTGGVGDTGLYALFKLYDHPLNHWHATLGISAPTGESDIKLNPGHHHSGSDDHSGGSPGYIHYGMQLGSGTWDFKPSLTYSGQIDDWSWGAQVNGTVRMENRNPSGFAFGDILQSTAWGGYSVNEWLTATVRGVYTVQGTIKNAFDGTHPTDAPVDHAANYGGRYWDIGFGLNASIPRGNLAGNQFGFEWLQPVSDDVNGYQLERSGALAASWQIAF